MAVFYNQATLSYNDSITNSNIVTGNITDVLSATKTALSPVYSAGDNATYIVSILNTGSVLYSGLTVTDNLGAYTAEGETYTPLTYREGSVKYYINGVLQPAPAASTGAPLTFSGISVPPGGNAILVYEATVNSFAPLAAGSQITNTVTVSGDSISDITATETISVEEEPVLTITKSLNPDVVTENSRITYTFVIQNVGNTPAVVTDNAVVTDTFDPVLSDISVTFNDEVWTEPVNYTYDETTGRFATVAGQITVPAATYAQDETGAWVVTPGVGVLRVTGTI